MNRIRFSHNWNKKLGCDVFTTIRKKTEEKEAFYNNLIGTEVDIILNDEMAGTGRVEEVRTATYHEVPIEILMTDTGETDLKEIDRIFKGFGIGECDSVLIIVIRKVEI